jgi:hypothetical protein
VTAAGAQGRLLKQVDTPKLVLWIGRLVGVLDNKADR